MKPIESLDNRVLILAPTGRDGPMTRKILAESEIHSQICGDVEKLCFDADRGTGAIVLTDEALTPFNTGHLLEFIEGQPSWSDIPIILFPANSNNAVTLLKTLGIRTNATIMERPVGVAVLISAVRSALRARRRQYQTRDLLAKLEEADRHKDLFLATLSHELRTPLTSMVGWVRLLKRGGLDEETTERALEVLDRSVTVQTQIIQDILSVSRIITGKFQLELSPVDLRKAVAAALDTVAPTARAKNIRINMSADVDLPQIMGDSVRLQQIIWNLLSNAIKFTPSDGRIQIRIQSLNNNVRLSVSDTGEGIAPDFLPYVFDRFRQADSSYTRRIAGLGLGLAIVRHLVDLHGGSVKAYSEGRGKGAEFEIEFPVAGAEPSIDTDPPETRAVDDKSEGNISSYGNLSGVRVLLVEDDRDARELLIAVLQSCGAEVQAAASGSEAFKVFCARPPDIVASDIGMPGEDGFSLMRRIRGTETNGCRTPAIALTGYVSEDDCKAAVAAGYQRHVSKPVQPDVFVRTIAELTREFRIDHKS